MANVVLKTEGLTKRFGQLTAVNELSLEVHEGEVFGFLGPNGAGKTTSISMMCGLVAPDAGRVLIKGEPVAGGDAAVRARVGVCPQKIVLWERLTCIEQLEFIGEMYGVARSAARRRGDELLAAMGLADKRDVQARALSGGMQRRLNLIMALVHDPEIVVLDEPEAGLDPQSRVTVRDYIQTLARKKTVILTTHNMDEADRVADRVAIIDHGQLLELDTPAALKQRIGQGDVVEVSVAASAGGEALRQALARAAPGAQVEIGAGSVSVRALNAVALLPAVIEALERAGARPGELRVRQNTLEDVFIKLTGRRLRE